MSDEPIPPEQPTPSNPPPETGAVPSEEQATRYVPRRSAGEEKAVSSSFSNAGEEYSSTPDPSPRAVFIQEEKPMTESYPAPDPVVLPPAPPQKSNRTVWIVVIVAVVLLCCCCMVVGGYLLLQGAGGDWEQFLNDMMRILPRISAA